MEDTRPTHSDPVLYVVWSHEHGAWWKAPSGYTTELGSARRFGHAGAMKVCREAIPGTADKLGAPPELPVRLTDALELQVAWIEWRTRRPAST